MVLFAALLAAAMDIASLQKMAARFAPAEVTADLSGLAPRNAERWRRSSRQPA
jgi:hypothetical protein